MKKPEKGSLKSLISFKENRKEHSCKDREKAILFICRKENQGAGLFVLKKLA